MTILNIYLGSDHNFSLFTY